MQLSLPWIVFEDFNEITHLDKKCGGAERSADQMQAFRNALDACDFLDLGFSDPSFYLVQWKIWQAKNLGQAKQNGGQLQLEKLIPRSKGTTQVHDCIWPLLLNPSLISYSQK